MITTYPTCRTAELRNLRHLPLSTPDASPRSHNPGMLLRVDIRGNRSLLINWLINIDVNKPVEADDSPYAGGLGIAAFAFDDSQVIGESGRSWSHSSRRRRGVIRT